MSGLTRLGQEVTLWMAHATAGLYHLARARWYDTPVQLLGDLQPVDRGCPDPHAMHSPALPFDVDGAARPSESVAVDVGADLRVSHPGEHGNWLGGHGDGFSGAAAFFPRQADRCG